MTADRHIPSHPNADAPTLPPTDPKAGGARDGPAPTLLPAPASATLAETIGATDALIARPVAGGRCFGEYELIVAAPPTLRLAEADLPPEREAETRSGAADMPAALTLINETPYTLELFWLDDRGRRVSRGWLHPRSTHEQSTFARHFFLVTDTAGRALGIIQPTPPSRTVMLRTLD